MKRALIIIAAHKMCAFPHIKYHVPMCVGAFRNREKYSWIPDTMFDDTAEDNISSLNSIYNELTGHYYVWKNIHEYEYYGLCHYRRYFNFNTKYNGYPRIPVSTSYAANRKQFGWGGHNIDDILDKYDVIAAQKETDTPPQYLSLYDSHSARVSDQNSLSLLEECIAELYPDFCTDAKAYFSQNKKSMFNMFIMKKSVFEDYSKWLFDILDLYEKKLQMRGVIKLDRSAGFMGEHLLNIYLYHLEREKVCIGYLQTVMINETSEHPSFLMRVKAFIKTCFGMIFPYGTKRRDTIKWKYFMKS